MKIQDNSSSSVCGRGSNTGSMWKHLAKWQTQVFHDRFPSHGYKLFLCLVPWAMKLSHHPQCSTTYGCWFLPWLLHSNLTPCFNLQNRGGCLMSLSIQLRDTREASCSWLLSAHLQPLGHLRSITLKGRGLAYWATASTQMNIFLIKKTTLLSTVYLGILWSHSI